MDHGDAFDLGRDHQSGARVAYGAQVVGAHREDRIPGPEAAAMKATAWAFSDARRLSLGQRASGLAGRVRDQARRAQRRASAVSALLAASQALSAADSLCGVVYQKSQFSFVRGGAMPYINKGSSHWRNAVAISKIALNDSWKSPVEGALFFHARYVAPGWRLKRIGTIDNHVFYR